MHLFLNRSYFAVVSCVPGLIQILTQFVFVQIFDIDYHGQCLFSCLPSSTKLAGRINAPLSNYVRSL